MQIFIPSRGRATLHRTFHNLPPQWQARATLVVPMAERKTYAAHGVPLNQIVGLRVDGIGKVRQSIIATAESKVLMLDDDLDFFRRRKSDAKKLVKAEPLAIHTMLGDVDTMLDRYAHLGIAVREGANRNTESFIENTRMLRALGYRADILRKHKVRFDRTPVMEDFDVALQLLRLGYPSVTLNDMVQDQPGSNTVGGCSTYRTQAVQALGAETLHKLHPEFVTVVEKPPLKSGGWSGLPRKDVRVAWKKAYESAGGIRDCSQG